MLLFCVCVFFGSQLGGTLGSTVFFNEKCEEYKKQFPDSSQQRTNRSINAEIGEFPHIAALAYASDESYQFRCGGTLISQKFLLIPAHCATSYVQPKFVRLGVVEIPTQGQTFDSQTDYYIKKITVHPSFNMRKHSDNIALVELEKKVSFGDNVRPVCLYSNSTHVDYQNTTCEVILSGWEEHSRSDHNVSLVLHKTKATCVPVEKCSIAYTVKYRKTISTGHICASENRTDTCVSEIGGPLQIYNGKLFTLVGVPSHGGTCGSSVPTVYSSVYHYLDWIKSVAWD